MANTDTEIERDIADSELMKQAGGIPLRFIGGGGKDRYGSGAGGRFSTHKQLADDVDLEAYLEANVSKSKGSSAKGDVTGGGFKVTKRFKKGGSVSSASKRADGIATKGKTKGRII